MTTGLDKLKPTADCHGTLTLGGDLSSFTVGDTLVEERGGTSGPPLVVTAIDREAGTITIGSVLKQLYSEDVVQQMFYGFNRTAQPTRLACVSFGRAPVAEGVTSAAVVAVVTTVAALEWLRHRKAAVAAAEGSDEAYRSLLSEFLIWLRRWLDGFGRATP